MNPERVSRNDPCPCGSGRKFKKCCHNKGRITALDRAMAIELIERHVESCDERAGANDIFCGGLDLDLPAMTEHFRETSNSAFVFWFAFDFQLRDGSCLVDRILAANPVLSFGERRYLEQMKATAMMPYEVVAVRPDVSVTLRGIGAREEVEVFEQSGSSDRRNRSRSGRIPRLRADRYETGTGEHNSERQAARSPFAGRAERGSLGNQGPFESGVHGQALSALARRLHPGPRPADSAFCRSIFRTAAEVGPTAQGIGECLPRQSFGR